tara:strand:+ start:870 stop:1592 length:723 start_codon:yes stop_codon:yes gene_type:complete
MKKLILFSLLCLCFTSCFEEKTYTKNQVFYTDDETCILKSNQKPLNGFLTSNFGDIGLYKNGKREGFHKDYYQSGRLKLRGYFKKGDHYDGKLEKFRDKEPNGLNPELEQNKIKGKLHGIKRYHINDIRYEESYTKGIIQWRIRTTNNGWTKLDREVFKNGKKHGRCTYTHEPMELFDFKGKREIHDYKDGKLHGKYIWTDYQSGEVILDWEYDNGEIISQKCYDIKTKKEIGCGGRIEW